MIKELTIYSLQIQCKRIYLHFVLSFPTSSTFSIKIYLRTSPSSFLKPNKKDAICGLNSEYFDQCSVFSDVQIWN